MLRSSLGGGGGGAAMGGGGGAGGALRSLGRAVARAGVANSAGTAFQESHPASPSSSSSSSSSPGTNASSSSKARRDHRTSPQNLLSVSHTLRFPNWLPPSASSDEYEWVTVDEVPGDEGVPHWSVQDSAIEPVPSLTEVHSAVSALQQVLETTACTSLIKDKYIYSSEEDVADQITSFTGLSNKSSSSGSGSDWLEPSQFVYNSRILEPYGSARVYDAFHLLQTEPSIQRMVISLSSDKAVWDAVLNNEVVRELRNSFNTDDINTLKSWEDASQDPNGAKNAVKWMFDNAKAKVMEIINKIVNLMNNLIHSPGNEKTVTESTDVKDPLKERLRTSFLLSVLVLLIVVVTRAHKA